MQAEAAATEEKGIENPPNPFRQLTETQLSYYIQKNAEEVALLDEVAFQKCAQRITNRDQAFLDELRNLRGGFFTVQRQVRQITQVLDERAENATNADTESLKQWRKMRKACLQVSKDAVCALEPVKEKIRDYQFDFPNEKFTPLKKLVQLGAVTAFAVNIAGVFFGDSAKAKGIAAGGAVAAAVLLDRVGQTQSKNGTKAPIRRTELKPYEIRQVYCFLS